MAHTDLALDAAALLDAALDDIVECDHHLLSVDAVSGASPIGWLSIWNARAPHHHIDCEFNRDGFDTKRLAPSNRVTEDDYVDAVTVFPDIVLHKRGTNESNFLVLEVKKASSRMSSDYDIVKLQRFVADLQYRHAAHVILGYMLGGHLVRDVRWIA